MTLKSLNVQMADSSVEIRMSSRSPASVMEKKLRTLPAPSMWADSYSSWGTACIPARNTSAKNGIPIQMSTHMLAANAEKGAPSQPGGWGQMPVAARVWLSSPNSG